MKKLLGHSVSSRLQSLPADLRVAFRRLGRNPIFAIVFVSNLALGVAVNFAIFSIVYAVILRPLPVYRSSELFIVSIASATGIERSFSFKSFNELRASSNELEEVSAFAGTGSYRVQLSNGDEPTTLPVQFVSDNYFSLLRLSPAIGRLFVADDGAALGSRSVAVLSFGRWQKTYGKSPNVVGREVTIAGTPFTIVGVAPRGFTGAEVGSSPDFWLPMTMFKRSCLESTRCRAFQLFARIHESTSISKANADLNLRWDGYKSSSGVNGDGSLPANHLRLESASNGYSPIAYQFGYPLQILIAGSVFLLLVVCVNLANMLLSRVISQNREFAIRSALGAGRGKIFQIFLMEGSILSTIAGLVGLFLGSYASKLIASALPNFGRNPILDVSVGWVTVSFATAVIGLTLTAVCAVPAYVITGADLHSSLKDTSSRNSAPLRHLPLGRLLVVVQVIIAIILVCEAGSFVKSIWRLRQQRSFGFQKSGLLLVRVSVPQEQTIGTLSVSLKDYSAIVTGTAVAPELLSGASWNEDVSVESYAAKRDENIAVDLLNVSPDFLKTLNLRLLQGRFLQLGDRKLTVVNRAFSNHFFPRSNPLGRHIDIPGVGDVQIVGVVDDFKFANLTDEIVPLALLPLSDRGNTQFPFVFLLRPNTGAVVSIRTLEMLFQQIDPTVRVQSLSTLESRIDQMLAPETLLARSTGFFAIAGIFLAIASLYALVRWTLIQKEREVAIRRCVGATSTHIVGQIIAEVFGVLLVGIVIGDLTGTALTLWTSSVLYGTRGIDLDVVFGISVGFLVGSALAIVPIVSRAIKVDPLLILRHE